MQSDDLIQVPTWRPDTTSPIQRAQPQQSAKAEPQPDDSQVTSITNAAETVLNQQADPADAEELAENLRRLNLTFDLFEIKAKFFVDEQDNDIKIIVYNTKTGEVIRGIPPSEFNALYDRFIDDIGSTFSDLV